MENQSIRHKKQKGNSCDMKKRDIIFLGILSAVAIVLLLWFMLGYREEGMKVEITIDGEMYGSYSLNEEQEIAIETEGIVTNILVIEDGKADMIRANCPDKLCVHQAAVSHAGETIVCLPNKVVVTVVGEKDGLWEKL